MQHDLTELIDGLPTEALELYVMEWETDGVGGYYGWATPLSVGGTPSECRCPRAALGYRMVIHKVPTHPADIIEIMAGNGQLDTEALYRACKAAILARDAAVERVREEVMVG